jgi:hypothetical protein
MTTAVRQLLASFDALTDKEKHEAATEVLRRTLDLIPPELSEADLVEAADLLFCDLDANEAADAQS